MTTCKPHGRFPCPDCGTVHYEGCGCSLCKHGAKKPTQLDRIEKMLIKLTAPKKQSKPRAAKKHEYPEWFELLWKTYPKRAGSNPKKQAFRAANTRSTETFDDTRYMFLGSERYKAFCDATGKTGTELVMQAKRFFGTSKEYENDWTIPTKTEPVPRNNDELTSWAADKGYRGPYVGESSTNYRKALETLYGSNS